MAYYHKTVVAPLLTHWSCHSIVLSYWFMGIFSEQRKSYINKIVLSIWFIDQWEMEIIIILRLVFYWNSLRITKNRPMKGCLDSWRIFELQPEIYNIAFTNIFICKCTLSCTFRFMEPEGLSLLLTHCGLVTTRTQLISKVQRHSPAISH